jgi:outer membrane lipoprotein-sorting protein
MDVSAAAVLVRHKSLRWAVPIAAVAVAGVVGSGVLTAQASPQLAALSAAQLLVSVEQAHVDGFSGQVVENASLGLPDLPQLGGGNGSTSFVSMLTGSHSTRIWYAGPTKQRFALLGTLGETDIFHDGANLWQWDSDTSTATHTALPPSAQRTAATSGPSGTSTLTPQQLAAQALAAVDPTTVVTTDQTREVAGRSAYDLVLTPKDRTSRIGSVRIAVDSVYKIPLSVQVYARGETSAAIDVSFTSIDFTVPSDSEFAFTPPKTAIVKQQSVAGLTGHEAGANPGGSSRPSVAAGRSHVFGTGWTRVVELPGDGPLKVAESPRSGGSGESAALFNALTPVSGSWGSGRLFDSKLATVLITDDGRIFAGAVDPTVLYAAAAAHR